jgi:hypothetical protein
MFTVLAMIDASGKIIGGPLMAALYSFGMDVRGRSAGVCFLTAAVSHRPSSHVYNDSEQLHRFCSVQDSCYPLVLS